MKSIRKIAGKVTALAVALLTTMSLLTPYYLRANEYPEDYYVDPYDWEAAPEEGGNANCGFKRLNWYCEVYQVNSSDGSGGGSASYNYPSGGSVSGNGSKKSSVTFYKKWRTICDGDTGGSRSCSENDSCLGSIYIFICNPDCTIKVVKG